MAIDPRTTLTFAKRQGPDKTHWLEIKAPADAEPGALYADLNAAGWVERYPAPPAHMAYDGRTFKPLGYSVIERQFTKKGSQMFTMWTDAEARTFMAQARAILKRHGFGRVPVWNKTLQDML